MEAWWADETSAVEPKAQVDQHIRDHFPELARKTTFLWVSWYAANMAYMPLIKPTELVSPSQSLIPKMESQSSPARQHINKLNV